MKRTLMALCIAGVASVLTVTAAAPANAQGMCKGCMDLGGGSYRCTEVAGPGWTTCEIVGGFCVLGSPCLQTKTLTAAQVAADGAITDDASPQRPQGAILALPTHLASRDSGGSALSAPADEVVTRSCNRIITELRYSERAGAVIRSRAAVIIL